MIDTHAHLDTEHFDADRAEVLHRARQAGVEAVIIPAITIDNTETAEQLCQEFDWVYRAAGIHPHHAKDVTLSQLEQVEKHAASDKVVAIGEIGLDYYYDFASPAEQQKVFREQLRIAKRVGLPVIIHNREADNDILRILEEEQDGSLQGVLHCFSSAVEVLRRALELRMYVSFTGNITFKRWTNDTVLQAVPDDRVMVETDSPYMTPVPHRGKRNEPAFLPYIVQRLAQARSMTVEDIVMKTTQNAKRLFGLAVCITMLLGCLANSRLYADTNQSELDSVEYIHPYPRVLGVGGLAGPNTIVETQRLLALDRTQPLSYEGIPAFGAMAVWEFADRWMIEAAYVFSENRKVLYDPVANPWGQQNPDRYHVVEMGIRYLFNPYSRVVFYGFLGGGSLWVSRDGGPLGAPQLAVTPGIGLFINISTAVGLFVPGGEWRLNFLLSEEERFITMGNGERYKAQISTFLSIPRFTVLYFPRW
ncbi:MAG: TatD family hydrolase [Candidatus Kapabacteria bacterium]|nr:TatD family hydrolase [Candidatus Kapabacteria bacterium]